MIIRSSVIVTIDALAEWQLSQPRVTLTGTVSDSSYSVWVNGIQANVTSGAWTASNVPVPPGGMAAFTVVAIPPGGNTTPGGGSTGDPADPNPSDPGSVQSSIQPETGSWVKPIRKTWTRTDSWDSDLLDYINMRTGKETFNQSTTWEWSEEGGGYGITVGSITYPEWLFTYSPDNWTIKIWVSPTGIGRCEMTWNWVGPGGGSYFTTNFSEFGDVWLQYAISEAPSKGKWGLREAFSDDSGGIIGHNKHEEKWTSATDQELSTGGIGGVERESVIRIAASEAVKLPNGDFTNVPPTQVSVTTFGALNTNATVDRPKPDNSKGAIDLDASADSYIRKPISNTGKYRLAIMRGLEDITGKTIKAVVGEGVVLSAAASGLPQGLTASNYQWSVEGSAISQFYVSPDTSHTNGRPIPLTIKTNPSINFYWVDGGAKLGVTCTAVVDGQPISGNSFFNVKKPTAKLEVTSMGSVQVLGDRLIFGGSVFPGISFMGREMNTFGYYGRWDYIQVGHQLFRYQNASDGAWARSEGNGLDGGYPNPNVQDAPYTELPTGISKVTASGNFTMYLAFKPSGGIYVPIRKINWDWSGAATNNSGAWSGGGVAHSDPTDAPAPTTLVWSNSVQNTLTNFVLEP